MKELTAAEESRFLHSLASTYRKHMKVFAGSSRIVFSNLNAHQKAMLHLPHTKTRVVAKVAVGSAGVFQMQQELGIYRDYVQPEDRHYFARIYAYGSVLEIMECINNAEHIKKVRAALTCSDSTKIVRLRKRDLCSVPIVTYIGKGKKKRKVAARIAAPLHLINQFDNIHDILESFNGSTEDNDQIGVSDRHQLKAYDYGFDANSDDSNSFIGRANDLQYDRNATANYLNRVASAIAAGGDFSNLKEFNN